MLRINIPEVSYSEQDVSLGGSTYTFILAFNDIDQSWRLAIYFEESLLVGELKIMPEQSLIRFRHNFDEFNHGDLQCRRLLNDNLPLGRDNFGIGKAYELLYLSNEELGL